MTFFYLLTAFAIGAMVSLQPPINGQMAAILGSPLLAATCSIAISLTMIVLVRLTLDRASIDWSRITALPWWTLVGGAVGAIFVIGALIVAPKVGIAAFFVFVVLGQLLGAAAIDHFGAFGTTVSAITRPRAIGILLVAVGAAISQLDAWR